MASGTETPREKSPERELLPNLKPNAEDFLTFLCFRGTSSLPKELDFTNSLNQPSTSGGASGSKSPEKKKQDDKKKNPARKTEAQEVKKDESPKPPVISEKDPKTGFMPFAVRKRAEVHPAKSDKKKVQQATKATKKKSDQKVELDSSNDLNGSSRSTRANPVEEKSIQNNEDSKKPQNKRKSDIAEEKSEKSSISTKNIKLDKSPRIELVPIEKVPNKDNKNAPKKKAPSKKEDGKRQTRLSALKSPPTTSTPKEGLKNGKEEPKKYFSSSSSDDDEPLLKAEPKNKKQKTTGNDKSTNNIEIVAEKSINDSQNSIKLGRGRKKKSPPAAPSTSVLEKVQAEESSVDRKKNNRKKKASPTPVLEKDNSQANTTDLSENETRGRPMRKTKEAATIYMELIGRKLTLHDSSDNDSSLDSLEVPNLKRVEMMEIELKEKLEKEKVAGAQKKKADEKKASIATKKTVQQNDSKNLKGKRGAAREGIEAEESKEPQKSQQQKPKKDDVIAVTSKEKPGDEKEKLEKSFSDSDEEPLATKLITTKQNTSKASVKRKGRKSQNEIADTARKQEEQRQADALRQEIKALISPKGDQKKDDTVKSLLSQKNENINEKKDLISPNKMEPPKIEAEANDDEFVKNFDSASPKPVQSPEKTSINLLPSKEESEKIFGIASVTLAQSSGPLDTKCTLGKCGSIHKPPLGPAVLTESALGASLSPKDRRKSKVNMTREQIEKWLDEASWTPIPDDEMESIDLKITSKASTSSVVLSKSGDDSQSSILTKEKVEPTPPTSLKEQPKKPESPSVQKLHAKDDKRKSDLLNVSTETKASSSALKTPTTNKQQPQQRRTPVYKTQMEKPKLKLTPVLPSSFGAFSPENEHSVYSFDREDDDHLSAPSAPFRKSNSKQEERKETTESFSKPTHTTPAKQSNAAAGVSLTLSPDDNKKSASIAVELATSSSDEKKNMTKVIEAGQQEKEGGDDSDSEGHTFYIPLQASNSSGSKTIQGVAVKLGTEGSEGPNQRIIMHAKLVTKSSFNATPLPESMSNVQELVKTLMANKETSKPVQPVQPRFKDDAGTSTLQPEPSTSSLVVNQRSTKAQQPTKLGVMSEAPIFRPTEKEFADPIEYIERITPIASRYGICRIIPPESFTKQAECRVSDEMRFTAYNQYVHKMLHRWGPSAKEFCAIKKYLATQSIVFQRPPLIAGIEVDLPRLYHTVQELGGLKEVIEKKKWVKVAEDMCIPKSAHDRVTKLDDIYCKYLLPYDTLSPSERQKLFDEVEADWAKREAKARRNADKGVDSEELNSEDEEESEDSEQEEQEDDEMECMVKGRSMALSQFYRIARNLVTLWFKTPDPPVNEIETEYWRHVAVRDSHVCVHYGSIDSSGYGYGFPAPGPKTKMSPCAKHPWNLKVLTNNCSSILRSLGPVMGVTVPTLHVGMLFSAVCWYRDPHGLPWIEYLHTGASKIWYAVPDEQSSNFRSALTSLVPSHCQNKTIWLPCDTTMVSSSS